MTVPLTKTWPQAELSTLSTSTVKFALHSRTKFLLYYSVYIAISNILFRVEAPEHYT